MWLSSVLTERFRVLKNFLRSLRFFLIRLTMNFGSLRYLFSFTLIVFAEVDASTDSLISVVNLRMVLSMSDSVIVGSKSYLLVFMRSCLSNSVQSMDLIVLLKLFDCLI